MTRAEMQRQPDGSVRFFSDEGLRAGWWYRVYDCTEDPRRRVPIELPSATLRIFVMAHGDQWVYRFRDAEERRITVDHLERQLAEATYDIGARGEAASAR